MKVFVNACNRLTWLKKICEDIEASGHTAIIIDNASTYPPLLQWYNNCPYEVKRVENLGRMALWSSGIYNSFTDRYFAYTDHDLDISSVPKNWADVLIKGIEEFPGILKCGLSLEINDLPQTPLGLSAFNEQTGFYKHKNLNGYYSAPVDTTFAVYDRTRLEFHPIKTDVIDLGIGFKFYHAVRAPIPYLARHLPWYVTKENITEEEKYYLDNIKYSYSWVPQEKKHTL